MRFSISEDYTRMGEEVMKAVPELRHLLKDDVRIGFGRSGRRKTHGGKVVLGECKKADEFYGEWCPYDFLIIIYEANCAGLDDDQMRILMEHELLHVGVKYEDNEPTYYVRPHDYDDFKQITRKYGPDWGAAKDKPVDPVEDGWIRLQDQQPEQGELVEVLGESDGQWRSNRVFWTGKDWGYEDGTLTGPNTWPFWRGCIEKQRSETQTIEPE